eukprot:COSAG01_NODE_14918_length_1392_cov_2.467593_2_plen_28_part_01
MMRHRRLCVAFGVVLRYADEMLSFSDMS